MKHFVVMTRLLKIEGNFQHYHFKGVYLGLRVEELIILSSKEENQTFLVGEDYLLYLKFRGFLEGRLYGEILKSKRLSEVHY